MEENIYSMWLGRIEGIGPKKQEQLLGSFGSPREVFRASRGELENLRFLNEQLIHKILSMQDNKFLDEYQRQLERTNMCFISRYAPEYPAALLEIRDPPIGLYVAGSLPDPQMPTVSVIGSRRCSEYGLMIARRFSKELALSGVVIVSGMARGVDSMAHRGALDAEGITIAVLGCGADVCYPPENRALMQRIKSRGCIISEYPPGTQPTAGFFPARNRIISGISQGTVVVEAGERSGTLITVDQALEAGREVMAVPGNVTSKLSYGTNELLKQGATPVTSSEDILQQLGITVKNERENIALAPGEKIVYDCISFEPVTVDEIFNKLNSPVSEITYVLTVLEMRSLIKRLPGQRFVRL